MDKFSALLLHVSVALIIAFSNVSCRTCGRNEFRTDDGRCCQMCRPGTGLRVPCTEQNATQCEDCIPGASFSNKYTREPCKPCSICPAYATDVHVCNVQRDIVCECSRNYFYDVGIRGCRRCTFCDVGFGLRRLCNSTHDTVCGQCPRDHFTEYRGLEPCAECEVCGENQVQIQGCMATQNAICIDMPTFDTPTTNNPAVRMASTPASNQSKSSSHMDAIPIYCGVLALIILVLVIYVAVRQRRKHKLNEARKAEEGKGSSPSKDDLRRGIHQPLRQTQDGSVYTDYENRPVTSLSRICEIPLIRRQLLDSMLQGGSNGEPWWYQIARHLGYSNTRLAGLEVRAKQDGTTPLQFLLTEYGRHDDTQVKHLVEVLYAIGREDAVHALYGELRDYVPAPRYMDLSSLKGQVV